MGESGSGVSAYGRGTSGTMAGVVLGATAVLAGYGLRTMSEPAQAVAATVPPSADAASFGFAVNDNGWAIIKDVAGNAWVVDKVGNAVPMIVGRPSLNRPESGAERLKVP